MRNIRIFRTFRNRRRACPRSHQTTATEVQKNFGFFQDEALKRPVFISKNGRPKTVLMSYAEFMRLKQHDRQAYGLDDLPAHLATAILDATVPEDLEEPR